MFTNEPAVQPLIDVVFALLAQPWLPWTLSALIVGVAFLLWVQFRVRGIDPVLAALDDAISAVQETEGPSSFKRRYAQVFQRLAENRVVGEVWRAFASTIGPAPDNDDALAYARRPQEHLNESLLPLVGVNLRFYQAVPNLLVGTGLLFTFLGLVGALYFASKGVAAAAIQEAQHALRELLAAATFKFATSIAGLGSSMLFSWREKVLLYKVQRLLGLLCAALDARMVPLTETGLAMSQLHELRTQTNELRNLGRNLLVRVPATVEDRLGEELISAVEPIRSAMKTAAGRLAQLDTMITEALDVNRRLGELTTAQTGAAERGGALDSLDRKLGETILALKDGLSILHGRSRRSWRQEKNATESLLRSGIEMLDEAHAAFVELTQVLETLPADAAQSDQRIAGLLASIHRGVASAGQRLEQATQHAGSAERP